MFTKPHYRQISARDVTPGMRIYSRLLGECFTVEKTQWLGLYVTLTEGCYNLRVVSNMPLWQETKTRALK